MPTDFFHISPFKRQSLSRLSWYMPAIPTLREVEAGRSQVQVQPELHTETLTQKRKKRGKA
jgi:hypothetical protein